MPTVDVLKFTCNDENEIDQDEVYVKITPDSGDPVTTSTYEDLDTGDEILPDLDPVSYNSRATIQLWEEDGVFPGDDDDLLGSIQVTNDPTEVNRGEQTVTLTGSGAEYNLTYDLWA